MSEHLSEAQRNGLADGTIAPLEREALGPHLAECAACRADVQRLGDLVRAAAALPRAIEPPADVWLALRGRLTPRPERRVAVRRFLAVAAAVLLVAGTQVADFGPRDGWEVAPLEGRPSVGGAGFGRARAFGVGQTLETDERSRAEIAVGRIGRVEVRPHSRVLLLDARPTAHRLALALGEIEAVIDAPPRVFIVETPSAIAIDLGCAYTLRVDSAGNGDLRVTAGWVELRWGGRRSIVPLGARARARRGAGPGIPYREDAPEALRRALASFDFERGGAPAVRAALAAARPEDALSVWHLLERLPPARRGAVFARLAALVPPPAGVTREAVVALQPDALERYWAAIRRIAWRRIILEGVRDIDPRTGLTR